MDSLETCPEDDLDEHERRRLCAICDDIVEVFDDFDAEIDESLQVLATLMVTIMTSHAVSRAVADRGLDKMFSEIRRGFVVAEENGSASWIRTRAH